MVACLLSYGCQISGKHQNPNRAKSMPGSCFYSVWKVTDRSRCEQAFDAAEEEGDECDGGKDQCGGEQESHAEDESQRDEEALDGRAGVEFLTKVGPPWALDMWGVAGFFLAQGSVGNIHHLDLDHGRFFCLSGNHENGRDVFKLRHVPA